MADDKTMGIVGLILNIIILPGLGTLVSGRKEYRTAGVWQLVMSVVGYVLIFTLIGAIIGGPLLLAAWIWGLIIGIKLVK